MEKLSRSQKYAGLKESLANSREENTLTNDLSGYQNTLNGFQSQFQQANGIPAGQPQYQAPQQPVYQAPQQPAYQAPQQPAYQAPQQPVYQAPQSPVYQAPQQPVYTTPVEQPVYTAPVEQPVYTAPAQNTDQNAEDIGALLSSLQNEVVNEPAPVAEPIVEEVKAEEPTANLDDFLSSMMSDISVDNKPVENAAPVAETPVYETKVEPASPDNFDFDSFLNETLNEVDDYNRNQGLTTIDEIPGQIINEVKNESVVKPEPVVTEVKEEAAPQMNVQPTENNYSDTVNVEIGKIMNEISSQSQPELVTPAAPVVAPTVTDLVDDFLVKEEPVNEHPVLTETLTEEKDDSAVEIMNLAELEKTESLTKTVTFAAPEEELSEDVDTPNKVLNVILIVLIVALFAVLGFVVYELISANII